MRCLVLLSIAVLALGGCASDAVPERPPLSEAEKASLREYWELYVQRNPRWPEARARWLAMSEAAQNTLVENLIRAMADEFQRNCLAEARRASAELVLLDRRSLDYLGFIVGDDRNSRGLRDLAVGCLVDIGTPAVPGLIRSLDSARFQARRLAARGLGQIGDRRAIAPLCRRLAEDDNFVVRREAAIALGRFADQEAMRALCRAVAEDREPLVVEAAAAGLGAQRCGGAVLVLVERLETEERAGSSLAVPRALRDALRRITGLERTSAPAAFGQWRPEKHP
ncbi:MAG: HEAT repeat domain-containing protein [Planctomycetes bacterium]|nr:HEAT repeat domain-containing protein [Planctomycetota bacterium]